MRRTLRFWREPTLPESALLLERVAARLAAAGAHVERTPAGALRISTRSGAAAARGLALPVGYPLAPISSADVDIVATGGPRRLCYTLRFAGLAVACLVTSAAAAALTWPASRPGAGVAAALIWIAGYILPSRGAARRFRTLLRPIAADVIGIGHAGRPDGPRPERAR